MKTVFCSGLQVSQILPYIRMFQQHSVTLHLHILPLQSLLTHSTRRQTTCAVALVYNDVKLVQYIIYTDVASGWRRNCP